MTELIIILACAFLISPLIIVKQMSKTMCFVSILSSLFVIALSVVDLGNRIGPAGIKEILMSYSICLILNIDNIISYIVVVEGFDTTNEEKNRAINVAILWAIFFREILIFVGMSLYGFPKWLFKLITIFISIYIWRKIYIKSDFYNLKTKEENQIENKSQNSETALTTISNQSFRFSKIITAIIFAESLFSFDSTNMIISNTTEASNAHIANLAAMCTIKPITTLIQITNKENKYLEERIWIPVVFVLTKTVLWG